MAITPEDIFAYYSGTFPDVLAIDSSGVGYYDGTEFIADMVNNFIFGPWQAILDYGGVTPDGVEEAAGASQLITALQLGNGIGPGAMAPWAKVDDPSVTGDRVLLLAGQGILRANYPLLDVAVYVGDADNPTADYFYHADNADGSSRNTAGVYLILPNSPSFQTLPKLYTVANGDFTITGTNWTSTTYGRVLPFKDVDGEWYCFLDFEGVVGSVANVTANVSGLSFDQNQVLSSVINNPRLSRAITGNGNDNVIIFSGDLAVFTSALVAGIVKLTTIPTFAEDYNSDIPWGITY